jgi:hypothetical protein
MLKVEGIAFRFLPDPVQIKNALEVSFSQRLSSKPHRCPLFYFESDDSNFFMCISHYHVTWSLVFVKVDKEIRVCLAAKVRF